MDTGSGRDAAHLTAPVREFIAGIRGSLAPACSRKSSAESLAAFRALSRDWVLCVPAGCKKISRELCEKLLRVVHLCAILAWIHEGWSNIVPE